MARQSLGDTCACTLGLKRWKISVLTAEHNWGWHYVDSWQRLVHNPGPDPREGYAKYPTRGNIDMPHYGQEFIHCHRACTSSASASALFFFGKLKPLHFPWFLYSSAGWSQRPRTISSSLWWSKMENTAAQRYIHYIQPSLEHVKENQMWRRDQN